MRLVCGWSLALTTLLLAAVPTALAAPPGRLVRVTLLQTNDVYQIAALDKSKSSRGGLTRVATLRKQILAESPHTVFLLAGDTLSPSLMSHFFGGAQMIDAWNALGLDFAVLGNHEFDFGTQTLKERMKESRFQWLAANVLDRKTRQAFGGMPSHVIREFEGVKVGFFGVLTQETTRTSAAGSDAVFLDPFVVAGQVVRKMRKQGARVVVAVSHLSMAEDKQLARSANIDVIVGGHEHTLMQSLVGHTPIFKMGSDATSLGRIDLNIRAGSGTLESVDFGALPVTAEVPEDPAIVALAARYEHKVGEALAVRVVESGVDLDARAHANRSSETNLGDLIADAFRKATQADAAIVNGGSVRTDRVYAPGWLTKKDFLNILPFNNPVVKIEVTGKVLKAALEHGVSSAAERKESGRFPQVSGMKFRFDGERPPGSRIVEVTVGGKPLDPGRTYSLAVTTYLHKGGDGYGMLQDGRLLVDEDDAPREAEVLLRTIEAGRNVWPGGRLVIRTDARIECADSRPAPRAAAESPKPPPAAPSPATSPHR